MLKEEKWRVAGRQDLRWLGEVRLDGRLVPAEEAVRMAEESGLDLVLVSVSPPVGRLMDYRKALFDAQKRAKALQRRQRASAQRVKEVKFRLSVGEGDWQRKVGQVAGFLEDGDRVDVKVVLRGREASDALSATVAEFVGRLSGRLGEIGRILEGPVRNGRVVQMSVTGRQQ